MKRFYLFQYIGAFAFMLFLSSCSKEADILSPDRSYFPIEKEKSWILEDYEYSFKDGKQTIHSISNRQSFSELTIKQGQEYHVLLDDLGNKRFFRNESGDIYEYIESPHFENGFIETLFLKKQPNEGEHWTTSKFLTNDKVFQIHFRVEKKMATFSLGSRTYNDVICVKRQSAVEENSKIERYWLALGIGIIQYQDDLNVFTIKE